MQRLGRGFIVRQKYNHILFAKRMDARQRIQKWWRCVLATKKCLKLKDGRQTITESQEAAATKIQAAIRGRIQRGKSDFDLPNMCQKAKLDKEEELQSSNMSQAEKKQSQEDGPTKILYLKTLQSRKMEECAVRIQRLTTMCQEAPLDKEPKHTNVSEAEKKQGQEDAATKIQAIVRGRIQRGKGECDLSTMCQEAPLDKEPKHTNVSEAEKKQGQEDAATKIQAIVRGRIQRGKGDCDHPTKCPKAELHKEVAPKHTKKSGWRTMSEAKKKQSQEAAATKIFYLKTLHSKKLEECAIRIQRLGRGFIVRQTYNHLFSRTRMDAIQHIQMWWRCILAKRIYSKLKDEWQTMREVKVKQNQEAAATKIQAVIRGKIQKGKSDFDLLTIRQQVQLDKEVAQLKVEAAELEALYLESDREHIRFLEELEEERQKEAVLHEERLRSTFTNLNSSFSSLPSVASLLASPGKDSRASSLGLGSDEIEKQRRANKRLRKVVCKMETEVKALKQNVETLSISNEDACDAVVQVKNAYLKQVVKNTRIEKETKNFLDEMESQMYWYVHDHHHHLLSLLLVLTCRRLVPSVFD